MKVAAWLGGGFIVVFVAMTIAMTSAFGGGAGASVGCRVPRVSVPHGILSQHEIEALWVREGGPASQEQVAGAVGEAESGGDPGAVGPPTRWGRAIGLMQILGAVLPGDLRDPVINMRNAVKKWRDAPGGGRNWSPWTTYTSGEYLKYMGGAGGVVVEAPAVCDSVAPGSIDQAQQLSSPRSYADLPGWAMTGSRPPEQVDARILPDAEVILRTYHLRVTAARESGHHTHGDGTALDMVPEIPYGWDATALRLAHDVGWTEQCAASGVAPVCPLKPWVRGVFYNGYQGHGDPTHCSGTCGPHIHVSWFASHYGASGLAPPNEWVRVFPVG